MKPLVTLERLKELLEYNPETGEFISKVVRAQMKPGDVVGGINAQGYPQISIDYRHYRAHRLAWFYVHGEWPKGQIDHIDGNRLNNKFSNLRDVPVSVNQQNRTKANANTQSGLIGAYLDKGRNKWRSLIKPPNGKTRHLGWFSTAQQAHEAYLKAKRELHEGCTI